MSTEQHEAPSALHLADMLDALSGFLGDPRPRGNCREAAAMLRASHALIVQMAEALKVISANAEYETEYDGRTYTKCHSCRYDELKAAYQDELKGHQDDCEYIAARTVLAAATQYLKGPKT